MPDKSNNGGRKRYTAAQKKAYYAGMGYGACNEGKAIPYSTEAEKASFRNGLAKVKEDSKKYPNRKGGAK